MLNKADHSREHLQFWRDPALEGAYLAHARYGAHEFHRHVHDEMVIAITESGAGRCRTRFGSHVSGPRTVWVCAPGEYHSGRVWEDRQWNYRGIYLDPSGLEALSRVFTETPQSAPWVPPGLYEDAQLAHLLMSAHRSERQKLPQMQRQARWWAAMRLLFEHYGQPKPHLDGSRNEKFGMTRVRDYIAAHYARNLSIDELVPLCGLSRYHLMRSFTREYGMPPHAYANQLRLIEAKNLIHAGLRPADAAATVGFYDQSHLTRLFKRAYGMTPGAYAALK